MGNQHDAPKKPVCLLDAENSHRCTEANPVVSYVKHLDDDAQILQRSHDLNSDRFNFDTNRFRKIGDELVSKLVLHESVSDGKCF